MMGTFGALLEIILILYPFHQSENKTRFSASSLTKMHVWVEKISKGHLVLVNDNSE